MKLSKDYIRKELEHLTVNELAEKLADQLQAQYEADGTIEKYNALGLHVDRSATVKKFTNMIQPYAPISTATDVMREFGVKVVEVK